MSTHPSGLQGLANAIYLLVLAAVFTPGTLSAQCEPLANSAKSQLSQTAPALGKPEFFDEPAFTVAGVTDTTNLGGHASGMAPPRTTEDLAKGVASLTKESSADVSNAPPLSGPEKSLRSAVKQTPDSFDANLRLGTLLAQEGRAREAVPYLERASQLNPQDFDAAFKLARAYAEVSDFQHARLKAREFLAQQSSNPQKAAQADASPHQAALHHLLAQAEEKLGNPLEAVREYQRAAELDPSEPNLFDWGAELLLHHAPEPAIEVFGKGSHLFPGSARMLVALGVAWYSHGSYQEAARRLCEATDLNPADPAPYPFLAKTLIADSTHSEGLVDRLGRFVRVQPENASANYYYALGLWKQRKGSQDRENMAQIRSLLENAVHLDPNLGPAYLQLGILFSETNNLSQAILAYQKATAATPDLADAHYRLAQAYRQAGEGKKAQEELETFKRVSKQSADEDERQRREIQRFVYTPQASPPKP